MKLIHASIALIMNCTEVIIDYLITQSSPIVADRLLTPAAKVIDYRFAIKVAIYLALVKYFIIVSNLSSY